ncbi:MAG: IS1182 family transposase [Candidatus Omnitrophica bacterium]|nr:IS1182 family transposase [Candidatus Omnitrophota bacterium]
MPIISGDRQQMSMFPSCIDDYVDQDDVVRAYDAFVDHLDWDVLNINIPYHMGRPKYDPKTMLKLLIYSYSYGIRSSRKIERACYHNLSYVWLTGNLKPDHKTIAEFRRNNKAAIKNVLKQCVRFCIKSRLIEGNILFVDGTKIRANASINNTWNKSKCQKAIQRAEQRITEILNECEILDQAEGDQTSLNKLYGDLADQEKRNAKVQAIMKEIINENRQSKNTVDADCTNMRSRQGSHAAYNVQHVVDNKHGLIINVDAVSDANDSQQFTNQIQQANEQLGGKCQVACADAGYAHTDNLSKIDQDNIKVIVPSQKQALHNKRKPFNRDEFTYNETKDQYVCPEGHALPYRGLNKQKGAKVYKISQPKYCRQCQYFGECTRSKYGRKVTRLLNEDVKQRLEAQYLEPDSQVIYQRRKEKVEHQFGHIKRNLGVNAFLMRGCEGAKSESSLHATCFNMARMITICGGVLGLIEKLAS